MMKKSKIIAFITGLTLILMSSLALSQNTAENSNSDAPNNNATTSNSTTSDNDSDKSWFLSFIEQKLSAPNRQIRLAKIDGVLSSQAQIGEITISDNKGIWLKITDAKMDWNRLALLRGQVSINELSAAKIEIFRKPLPDTSAPDLESGGFSIPQLPVAVNITKLNAEDVVFDQELFGLAANVGLKGGITLANGNLNTNLNIARKDKAGQFDVLANISNENQQAEIAITASEPENGLIANLLQIENRPAIDLSIEGKGSLDDLVINIIMQAGKSPFLNGSVSLKGSDEGKNISANISGPIAVLMPPQYHAFFGQDTALELQATVKKQGGFLLNTFKITGAAVNLNVNAEILADGFLRRLNINGHIANQNGQNIILPIQGGTTSVEKIDLAIHYGDDNNGQTADDKWVGQLQAQNFKNPQFSAQTIRFDMGGVSENLDNADLRHVGLNVQGQIDGIHSDNKKMAMAIGKTIHLNLQSAIKANMPYQIDDFSVDANGFSVWLKGALENMVYQGAINLKADDLQALSLFGDKKMQGNIDIKTNGTIALLTGGFDLTLDGNAKNIKTGNAQLDALLKTDTVLNGGVARNQQGLIARNFQLGNQQIQLQANGQISKNTANMDIDAKLADTSLLDPRIKGPLQLKATARGHNRLIAFTLAGKIDKGQILDRKLQDAQIYINALLDNTSPYQSYLSARLTGNGQYDGKNLQIAGTVDQDENGLALNDLQITQGNNQISGTISQNLQGLLEGKLHINAPDLAPLASLALTKGSGAVVGDFRLFSDNDQQQAEIISTIKNLKFANNEIGNLDINATISTPLAAFQQNALKLNGYALNGYVKAKNIKVPNLVINQLDAKVYNQNGDTAFQLNGEIVNSANNAIKTAFSGLIHYGDNDNIAIKLNDLTLNDKNNTVSLIAPTTTTLSNTLSKNATAKKATTQNAQNPIALNPMAQYQFSLDNLQLKANKGVLKINGNVGETLNLAVDMTRFPLSIANTFKPDLGASGIVTGQAKILGTLDNPNISFDINGDSLTVKTLEDYQIDPLNITAKGNMKGKDLQLEAIITGSDLKANISGSVAVAKNTMDMQVELQNFPISLANGFIKEQNFIGNITGKAHIFGAINNPSASFNLDGKDLAAKILSENGLTSLNFNASGNYDNNKLDLQKLNINGPEQLNINVQGQIPLQGNGLNVQINGSAPLAIANRLLAERGAQVSGDAAINATIKGSLKAPELGGNFTVQNGQFLDAQTNIRLKDLNIGLSLNGNQIIFDNVRANSSYGGSVTIGGSLSTDFAAGLPLNLTLTLNHARYNDGTMVAATVSGSVQISGALLQTPLIEGDITIEKAEITLADNLSSGSLMAVKHKNLTEPIATTLKRAGVLNDKLQEKDDNSLPFSANLRVKVHAANQIYVRGMGLDAELGGTMGINGSLSDIRPVGGFQLVRGRFEILSQRLDFTEGSVTLVGNLNPEINFIATSQGSDITVTVTVSGKADAPKIEFSSSPSLPQDEVLARLIFKRSVGELSPLQIASLASAVAELSGITNESIFTTLRNATGLDDLDVITDDKGNTGLKAGRYIQDNVYLGVEAGSSGETKGTVNLDISESLKTKGSLDTNGDSSLGLYFEKDY